MKQTWESYFLKEPFATYTECWAVVEVCCILSAVFCEVPMFCEVIC